MMHCVLVIEKDQPIHATLLDALSQKSLKQPTLPMYVNAIFY